MPSPPFPEVGTRPSARVLTPAVTRPCRSEPAPLQQALPAEDLSIALITERESFVTECSKGNVMLRRDAQLSVMDLLPWT